MSYEGYYQILCQNGHLCDIDCRDYSDKSFVCPECGEKSVWWNSVDVTNGSFGENPFTGKEERIDGYIELEIKESPKVCVCKECGTHHWSTTITYKLPPIGVGHHEEFKYSS